MGNNFFAVAVVHEKKTQKEATNRQSPTGNGKFI